MLSCDCYLLTLCIPAFPTRRSSDLKFLLGRKLGYVDLSLFQIVEGLRYGFPKRMKRFEKKIPKVIALHDRVAKRPRIAAYLASAAHPVQPMGHLALLPAIGRLIGIRDRHLAGLVPEE